MKQVRPKVSPRQLRRLLGLVFPHWRFFSLGMVALAGGSAINLALPEVVRQLVNREQLAYVHDHLWSITALLIGMFAVQGICFFVRSLFFALVGQRVVAKVRSDLYRTLLYQPLAFFDSARNADLVSRISSDAQLLQDAVSIKLSVVLRYALQVIVGVVLMSFISATLTLATILILPLLTFLSIVLAKRLKRLSRAIQDELGQSGALAHESFDGIRVVKAFSAEPAILKRFGRSIEALLELGRQRAFVSAFFSSFVSFLLNGCLVAVFLYGVVLVDAGKLAAGDLAAFFLYGAIVAVSFSFVAAASAEFAQALGAAERIFDILDRGTPSITTQERSSSANTRVGAITLEEVSFAYPARPNQDVLSEISCSIAPGKITALVGPSGSGKSTLVNLLLGFYPVRSGRILVDGHPSTQGDLEVLRERFALVPQEQMLFATTIEENLRYGNPNATIDQLEVACQKAHIMDFIRTLPKMLATEVGERGIQLSTGQKQRLAIARAILRNPELLILDEATSSLDAENEFLIQQALQELLRRRTSLIIAHRLATVKQADHLIVLDGGRIVQQGDHASLVSQVGLYRQLVEKQLLMAEGVVAAS